MRNGESPSCSSDRQSRWRTSITMACRDQLWPCRRLLPTQSPPWSAGYSGDVVVGGCLSEIREQLFFFDAFDFLMSKQTDPIPLRNPHAQFLIGWQTALPTSQKSRVNPCDIVSVIGACMSVFISFTAGLVPMVGLLTFAHLRQRERLAVCVMLIYCSVSEHYCESLNF